jgi:membrane dipeptidase
LKKWVLIGLALVVAVLIVAGVRFFATTPGKIDRSQNKIEPVPLSITPAAQALQSTLDVADMHADSLLWKRDLLTRSDRGHIDLPRLIEGHYALQVFSSVTKSPKGQNYDSNGADSDTITNLAIIDLQPPRTWTSLLERSLWHAEKLRSFPERSGGRLRLIRAPSDIDRLLADRKTGIRRLAECCRSKACRISRATSPIWMCPTPPASEWRALRTSSTMTSRAPCMVSEKAG